MGRRRCRQRLGHPRRDRGRFRVRHGQPYQAMWCSPAMRGRARRHCGASQSITARPGSSAASCSARARVRLAIVTLTPRSSRAAAIARVEPPAPRIKAGPAAGSTPLERRFSRKPQPSVLLPLMRPFSNTSVLTAPARRAEVFNGVRYCECSDLVRNGDVNAGKARPHQASDGGGEVRWFDRKRHIGTIDAMAFKPKSVQPWGAGMADRPTGNSGEAGVAGEDGHEDGTVAIFVLLRGVSWRGSQS